MGRVLGWKPGFRLPSPILLELYSDIIDVAQNLGQTFFFLPLSTARLSAVTLNNHRQIGFLIGSIFLDYSDGEKYVL